MSKFDLETIRHSAAHVMAAAVKQLYPDARFDIGPATDNGFYYDFDMEHRLVNEDLKEIEKVMKKLIGRKLPFERFEATREEAQKLLEQAVGNDVNSSLWFYDSKYHKHIYFENQNEIRLAFHGYHLDENEENFNNISIEKLTTIIGKKV